MAFAHSSYIKTIGATDIRARDVLSYPFPARPQAMSIYLRFVESGSILVAGSRLIAIDIASSAVPRLFIWAQTQYQIRHDNEFGNVTATLAAAPVMGNSVELCGQLNANGSVNLIQSINGAATTETGASAALTLAQAWSASLLWINSVGTNGVGVNAFRNIEIQGGIHTMQDMRSKAGTD